MIRNILLSVVVSVVCLTGANPGQANPRIYEKLLPSTAWIVTSDAKKELGWGSGVVIDVQKKWVLTNYHVLSDVRDFMVIFPVTRDGRLVVEPKFYLANVKTLGVSGKVIQRDKQRDMALVEVKSLPAGIQALSMAGSSPKPGETLHTIGNSGVKDGNLWRYTRGEVRQVYAATYQSNVAGSSALAVKATVVETQMPLNAGDSGGPVVNDQGLLVAINQSSGNGRTLVSRGIDLSEIRSFLKLADPATRPTSAEPPTRRPRSTR